MQAVEFIESLAKQLKSVKDKAKNNHSRKIAGMRKDRNAIAVHLVDTMQVTPNVQPSFAEYNRVTKCIAVEQQAEQKEVEDVMNTFIRQLDGTMTMETIISQL